MSNQPNDPEYVIRDHDDENGRLNDPDINANWREIESDNIANGATRKETIRLEKDFNFRGQDKPTGVTIKIRTVHCCGHTNNGRNEFAVCCVCGGTICTQSGCALRCDFCHELAGPSHRYIDESGRVRCLKCKPKEINILVILAILAAIIFLFLIYSKGCV